MSPYLVAFLWLVLIVCVVAAFVLAVRADRQAAAPVLKHPYRRTHSALINFPDRRKS